MGFKYLTTLMIVGILLAGCASQDQTAFQEAQQTNTTKAYQSFLRQYPNGQYAILAREALDRLAEDDARFGLDGKTYGGLEALVAQHQGTKAAQRAATVMSRWKRYIVSEPEMVWHPRTTTNPADADVVCQVECSADGPFDVVSPVDQAFKKAMGGGDAMDLAMANMQLFADQDNGRSRVIDEVDRRKAESCRYWFLIPSTDRDSFGYTPRGAQTITYHKFANGLGFGNSATDASGVQRLTQVFPIVYFQAEGDFVGLCVMTRNEEIDWDAIKAALKLGAPVEMGVARYTGKPVNAVITGVVRLDNTKWFQFQDGVELKGGGLHFSQESVSLLPGTEVARKL